MATPGELVKIIAKSTGEDEATVAQYDRNLAIAGERSTSGRGRSAKKIAPAYPPLLLTAVLGSRRVRDGVSVVRRYRKTQEHHAHWHQYFPDKLQAMGNANVWDDFGIEELAALPLSHNFIDALTVLISLAAEHRLPETRVTVRWPDPFARISLTRRWRAEDGKYASKSAQANYHSDQPPPDYVRDTRIRPPLADESVSQARIERWAEIDRGPLVYIGALLAGKLDELPTLLRVANTE